MPINFRPQLTRRPIPVQERARLPHTTKAPQELTIKALFLKLVKILAYESRLNPLCNARYRNELIVRFR